MPRKTKPKVDAPNLVALEAQLKPLTPTQLRKRFFDVVSLGAHYFAEAAICVKLLKERNADISDIPMAETFLEIANGKIDPVAFLEFIASPARDQIASLPVKTQRELARKPKVKGVDPRSGKVIDVDLRTAPAEQSRVVLGANGPRSEEEQHDYIRRTPAPAPREPEGHQVSVFFKTAELSAIQEHVRLHRTSVSILLWRLAGEAGYLKPPKKAGAKATKAARASATPQ